MSNEIPDKKVETSEIKVPEVLKVYMQTSGFEATQEEVDEFNRLSQLSIEGVMVERGYLLAESELVAREHQAATGLKEHDLGELETRYWRKLAVCRAALIAKQLVTVNNK
jgi:hypothetical protein